MNTVLRYTAKKWLKILLWALVVYLLAIPVLFWMYKQNRGLDWWSILGGDPRIDPQYRTYLVKHGYPSFNLWAATRALPFTIITAAVSFLFLMTLMIVQFAALFWFLARGRTYVIYPREYDVSFDDVRGQPEIVASTKEALKLFQGFKKFRDAGGYPPHGILFEGPPGTGKTLLGKAIAGSARVPFVYASGSSFTNMFLGVGNLRIMRMFKRARKMSQRYGGAVVFIDELDAVGGSRGGISMAREAHGGMRGLADRFIMPGGMGGMGGMYVNELLIQMDGMTMPRGLWRHVRRILHLGKPKIPHYNLMVIGATNQASSLDPALLRPGRFDRKLHVGNPSVAGREDIIRYYLNKVPHDAVDTARLARATPGFSPAQIKNLVNEALIFALMDGRERLNFADLWDAKVSEDLGLKEADRATSRDKQMTAFHEAGHAVVAYVLRVDHQIQIASIIKRGRALGVVYHAPIEEHDSELSEDMRRDITVSLAGLAAEQIWFEDTTGGPSADLRNATFTAARMFGFFGMGDNLMSYGVLQDTMSQQVLGVILEDPEHRKAIGRLLAECKQEAVELLKRNEPAVRALAERLIAKGEVPGEEIEELMRAKAVARATPSFRPVLELAGENWHEPALLEATNRESSGGRAAPTPAPEAPSGGPRDERRQAAGEPAGLAWWEW